MDGSTVKSQKRKLKFEKNGIWIKDTSNDTAVTKGKAKRLIVQGFLSEVVEKISDDYFKNYFLKKTEEMLAWI